MTRVRALAGREAANANLNPACFTRLLDHGRRTRQAIVLLHGLCSGPPEFDGLGQSLHARGYNVLLPRLPHHGLADRMTGDLSKLTAEELAGFGDTVADIARGLGEQVVLVGHSTGGTIALWLAQARTEVALAVPISPFLGIKGLTPALNRRVARLALTMPDFHLWWDPLARASSRSVPDYGYPRFPVRALGQILRLAAVVEEQARMAPPAAAAIRMVTNACDMAVSNDQVDRLVDRWRRHRAPAIESYRFSAAWRLPHAFIAPGRVPGRGPSLAPTWPGTDTNPVVPLLLDLVTCRAVPGLASGPLTASGVCMIPRAPRPQPPGP